MRNARDLEGFLEFCLRIDATLQEKAKKSKEKKLLSPLSAHVRTPFPPSVAHPPSATSVAHPLSHSGARVPATGEEERVLLSLPYFCLSHSGAKKSGTGEGSHIRLFSPLMPLKQKTQVLEWVLKSKRVIVVARGEGLVRE